MKTSQLMKQMQHKTIYLLDMYYHFTLTCYHHSSPLFLKFSHWDYKQYLKFNRYFIGKVYQRTHLMCAAYQRTHQEEEPNKCCVTCGLDDHKTSECFN